jgi:hypothetical protein
VDERALGDRAGVTEAAAKGRVAHCCSRKKGRCSVTTPPTESSNHSVRKIRLLIWLLQKFINALQKRWFQRIVIRPAIIAYFYWYLWAFLLDRLPKGFERSDPKAGQTFADLKAQYNSRVSRGLTDNERAFTQSTIWGAAGLGAIILVAIVTTTHDYSPAIWVAAVCFGLTIPMFAALGFADSMQTDPKKLPPTVKEVVFFGARLYFTHFIFWFGFAAFLWSYSRYLSAIFMVGCFLLGAISENSPSDTMLPRQIKQND